jgi:hypothetical protein
VDRAVGLRRALLVAVALSLGCPPAAQAQARPDPTKLPVATTAQAPLTTAYGSLGVRTLAAGGSYKDPTTSVRIYKLTSATFPAASSYWGHDYAEGGDEVSLPHTGTTRTVKILGAAGHWLVDFTPGVGVSKPRQLSGRLRPAMDLCFTFSNNPATPASVYIGDGTGLRRFDVRTLAEAPGGGWPVAGEAGMTVWLHQSMNDGLFTWMRGASNAPIVGYEPTTATKKVQTLSGINEPRIDRGGRYIALNVGGVNGLRVWDWQSNTVGARSAYPNIGDESVNPLYPFAHMASLRRRWIGTNWNVSRPNPFWQLKSDVPNSAQTLSAPAAAGHGNGNWIQPTVALDDQWAVFYHYGALRPAASDGELSPGGMVLMTANGQRRLLAHLYNTSGVYERMSFAKFSPDGAYVLFTSDMNGSGRSDVFLAELPMSDGGTPLVPSGVTVQ